MKQPTAPSPKSPNPDAGSVAPLDSSAGTKPPRHRSPNYPATNLAKAVDMASTLQQNFRGHHVPIATAHITLGYKAQGSTAQQAIASMSYFGLLEDDGSGDKRHVRVSERAAKIIGNHADRPRLLKEAALQPAIHSEIWDKFYSAADGLAPDDTIRQYLVFDRASAKFNPEAVPGFLDQFKKTISFSKLDSSANIVASKSSEGETPVPPTVGDYVQWVSNGTARFEIPRAIQRVSDNGMYAFVDGSAAGLLLSELTIERPPTPRTAITASQSAAPVSPFAVSRGMASLGVEEAVFPLDEGRVTIQWPSKMSRASFDDFEAWVALVVNKAKRSMAAVSDDPSSGDGRK